MHATMTQVDVGFMAGHTAPRRLGWIGLGVGGGNATAAAVSAATGPAEGDEQDGLPYSTKGSLSMSSVIMPQHHLWHQHQSEGGTPIVVTPVARSGPMNRRREISQLIRHYPLPLFSATSDLISESNMRCCVHPHARVVGQRCPICAAESDSTGAEAFVSQEVKETSRSAGINEISENSIDDTATIFSGHGDELEEVSLDPKWAEALRAISLRLANEKAQQSMNPAVHVDSPVDITAVEASEEESPNRTIVSIPNLTDLQRTIQQATKSIGKFSLDDDNDANDGDISLSSFASDANLVTKNFAESKKQTPPRRGSLRSLHLDDPAPWSQGFEFYPKQLYFGAIGTAQHDENNIGSGSSVASSLTCESYNSLSAPPKPSRGTSSAKVFKAGSYETVDSAPMSDNNIAYRTSLHNTKLGPSLIGDCMNTTRVEDTFANTNKFVTRRSPSKRHLGDSVEVNDKDVAEESGIGRRATRSASPSMDDTLEIPKKSLLSFLTALGRNSRSRSCSRPRQSNSRRSKSRTRSKSQYRSKSQSRSKSRTRSKSHSRPKSCTRTHIAKEASETTEPWKSNTEMEEHQTSENVSCTPPEISMPQEAQQRVEPTSQILPNPEIVQATEESLKSLSHAAALEQLVARCPMSHPRYKLGDAARDEDMIIFPKSRHGRGRTRRRETNNSDSAESLLSSSGSDSNDREAGGSKACKSTVDIRKAIGQLRHLDAAFSEFQFF